MDERDNIGVEEKFVSSSLSLSLSKSNILVIQELMIMPLFCSVLVAKASFEIIDEMHYTLAKSKS